MAFPSFVKTRKVTIGGAMGLESAQPLSISADVSATKGLIWNDTGYRFEQTGVTASATVGNEVVFDLPVTDQQGWRDPVTNSIIDVSAEGSYTHMYVLSATIGAKRITVGPFPLPLEDGSPVDLDTMLPAGTSTGAYVSVPDTWDAQVTAARRAATDAAISAQNAAQNPPAIFDVSNAFAGQVLQARGNSWVEGGGEYAPPYVDLLPAALGFASIDNKGRAGRRAQDNAVIMVASSNPLSFDTSFDGPLLINDLGNNLIEADTPANRSAATESARVMLALSGATKRIEQTGWVYRNNENGESWGDDNPQGYASGGSIRAGFFTGLQVDIPVTAGTSYLLCHGVARTTGRGATVRITQNGVLIAEKSLDDVTVATPPPAEGEVAGTGAFNGVSPVAIRLPNLTAGIVTVTVDQKGVGGAVALIDALLPQAENPRLVMMTKPPSIASPTHQKPELHAFLRTIPDTMRAEFGEHIFVIDPEPGWFASIMLGADGLHPTVFGTEHVRDAFVLAVRARAMRFLMQQVFGTPVATTPPITTPPPATSGGGFDNGYDTGF